MRLLLLLLPFILFAQDPLSTQTVHPVCYFHPPANWEIAQPKHLSPHVQIGFIGKGSTQFRPSINLAFEEVEDVSLKEYLKAVKELHLAQTNTKWRDLGKFPMQAGEGRLTEITSVSAWGEVKMLQAIVLKENIAYILTAAVVKPDLPKFQAEILKSFQSLNLVPDLFSPIKNDQKRLELRDLFSSLGHFSNGETPEEQQKQWELLQKRIAEDASYMGNHWQFLVLKEGHERIYSSPSSSDAEKASP